MSNSLEGDIERLKRDADKTRRLLESKGADDLIPMILSNLDDIYPVRELAPSPNGRGVGVRQRRR